MMVHIEATGPAQGNGWWKELAGWYLQKTMGQGFAIHCWEDEREEIRQALGCGTVRPSSWAYGAVITGKVTKEFGAFLLSSARFQKTGPDGGAQMTPFFNVFLGDVFFSAHYGREVDMKLPAGEQDGELGALLEALSRKEWLTVYPYDAPGM